MPLLSLPNELLLQVAKDLDMQSTHSLILVNRRLSILISQLLPAFALEEGHCVTALHIAASKRDEKMIRMILEGGAPVLVYHSPFEDAEVPFSIAKPEDLEEVVEHLLNKRAKSVIREKEMWGFTALHLAVRDEKEGVVRLLLRRGASATVKDMSGMTPLHLAVSTSESMVRVLLENGVPVDICAQGGFTALHQAARSGEEGVVRLLVDWGADIEARTITGSSPLHLAVVGDKSMIGVLLKLGAQPCIRVCPF